jgi:hypothetical protein
MDLIKALPANSSANTNTGNNRGKLFSMLSAPGGRTGLEEVYCQTMKFKHASTTMGDGVFRGIRAKELS